jgi:hypothetical protein
MSNYFTFFPKVGYDLEKTNNTLQLTNLMRRFAFDSDVQNKLDTYYSYTIQYGDRPDTVAEKYYGSSKYDWVVLLYNKILHPSFDWPLFGEDFNRYIIKKYGSLQNAYETTEKYFKIVREKQKTMYLDIPEQILEIDETTYNTLPDSKKRSYSTYEWEVMQNEERMEIKLLDKSYLDTLLGEVENILREDIY